MTLPTDRIVRFEDGQNFRDLGGYKAAAGRTVRWGQLYRSGSMDMLTAADRTHLRDLGIKTICDFRDARERATAVSTIWGEGHAPRVLADDYHLDLGGIGTNAPGEEMTIAGVRAVIAASYPRLLQQLAGQYHGMFAALLAGEAPLVFHCTAGKDRTGIAAALLLTALGVPRATIIADYELTNQHFDPTKVVFADARSLAHWQSLGEPIKAAFTTAEAHYLETVLSILDAYPGGATNYLAHKLGLQANELVALREMYTQA